MNLPENYIVICETKEESNEVINFIKPTNTKIWQFWNYITISKNDWNIYGSIEQSKRWFEKINITYYKTFTFKEWKEMKENKTPPKYWFIKVTEETLDSINKVRAKQKENNEPIKTSDYDYYGKSKKYCPFGGLSLDTIQEENLIELTLEEFKYYFLEEEFTFPEKWCILATKENIKEISDFFVKLTNGHSCYKGDIWIDWYFNSHCLANISIYNYKNFTYCSSQKREGFEEISIEQFRKLTNLKSETMQKLIVPITDVLEIHKIACSSWKTKLVKYLERTDSNQNVSFTQIEINEMFDAATSNQKPVLTKIFGEPAKPIEWDKIKSGSKVILNQDISQIIGGNNNVDYSKPFDVVFWKTPHSIDCNNEFKSKSLYDFVSTFYQNKKYIRFDAEVNTNYISEVIEY